MISEWKRIVEIGKKENIQKLKIVAKNGAAKYFEDFYRWMENFVADFEMKENGKNWIRKIKVILSLENYDFYWYMENFVADFWMKENYWN